MKTKVRTHLRRKKHGKSLVHQHKRKIKKQRIHRVIDPVPVIFWKIRDAKTGRLLGTTTKAPTGSKEPDMKNYGGIFNLFGLPRDDGEYPEEEYAYATRTIKNKQSEMERRATTIARLREKPAITLEEKQKIENLIDHHKRKIVNLGVNINRLNKKYFPDNPR